MAKPNEHNPVNPKYVHMLESRDKVYSFLQQQGIINAGVGVGRNKETQDFCLIIHLENSLPPEIREKVQVYWPGTEFEVVGHATAY